MDVLISQTVVLIGELPGSLVYHLVLLFALQTAAALAVGQRGRSAPAARLALAAGLSGAAVLISLIVTALAAWPALAGQALDGPLLLPPLTRAVQTLCLLAWIWAAAFPKPSRPADLAAALLGALVLAGGAVTLATWAPQAAGAAFNGLAEDTVWGLAQVALTGLGLLAVVLRRPSGWPLAVGMLLVLLAGQSLHLIFLWPGTSLAGTVRLAELAAVPFFVALGQRRSLPTLLAPPAPAPARPDAPARRTTDSQAALALAALNAPADSNGRGRAAARAAALACRAELCLLVTRPDDQGNCSLASAYDLDRQQFLDGKFFSVADLPALQAALAGDGIRLLQPADHGPDLRRLAGAAGLSAIGPTLIAPLNAGPDGPAALALMALYGHREWSAEEQDLLRALLPPLAEALRGGDDAGLRRDLQQARAQVEAAEAGQRQARAEADQLSTALQAARGEAERLSQSAGRQRQEASAAGQADVRSLLAAADSAGPAPDTHLALLLAELAAEREQSERAGQDLRRLQAELDALRAQPPAPPAPPAELDAQRGAASMPEQPAQWEAERLRLKSELEAAAGELSRLESQAKSSEAQRVEARAQAVAAEAELAEARAKAEAAEARLAETHSQALAAEAQSAEAQARAQASEAQLAEAQARAQAAQVQLASGQAAPEQVSGLQRELDDARAELSRLKEALRASEAAARAGAEQAKADRERALADFHGGVASFSEQSLPFGDLQSELEDFRAQLAAAHDQLRAREAELAEARAALGGAPAPMRPSTPPAASLPAPDSALVESLRSQLAAAEVRSQQQAQALAQSAPPSAQLAAAQARIAELQDQAAQMAAALAEMASVQAQLVSAEDQLAGQAEALAAAQRQVQALTAQAAGPAEGRSEAAALRTQLAEVQAVLRAKDAQLARALAGQAGAPALPATAAAAGLPPAAAEVLASFTQDLRHPMAAIVGYSDLLLGESVGILGGVQRKFLERIKAACERMEALLVDLARLADIDSQGLRLAPESLDVRPVIDDAVQSCEVEFTEQAIRLERVIAPDLPPLRADRDALRQIVHHLLSNAGLAAGNGGSVSLTVRAEADPAAGVPGLRIEVQDSGSGVAADDQPRVFQRLYRASGPRIAGLGETGIGLAVAKALVEALGGQIWLTSEPGRGTTFHVQLPLGGPEVVTSP